MASNTDYYPLDPSIYRQSPFYQETKLLPLSTLMIFSEFLTESEKHYADFWWRLPGTHFAWKDISDESIIQTVNAIRTTLDGMYNSAIEDNKKLRTGHSPIAGTWDLTINFYSMSDAVRLDCFLKDFDNYSSRICRPKEDIRFATKESIATWKIEIQKRHEKLVAALRSANKSSMVLYGSKFLRDASLHEKEFCRVFLDIPVLFRWLVNESGIDLTWIPYPIVKWTEDNKNQEGKKSENPGKAILLDDMSQETADLPSLWDMADKQCGRHVSESTIRNIIKNAGITSCGTKLVNRATLKLYPAKEARNAVFVWAEKDKLKR